MTPWDVHFQRTVTVLLWVGGSYILLRWLLVPLLPFLLALAFSTLTEPLVKRIQRRMALRRSFAAVVVTTALLLVVGGGVGYMAVRLILEAGELAQRLPELLSGLPRIWNDLLSRLEGWYASSHPSLRTAMDRAAQHITDGVPGLVSTAGSKAVEVVSSLMSHLPDAGLFLVTTVLAIYFTSLSYPAILSFLKEQLPLPWQRRCRKAAQCCRETLLKWLRAEATLIAVTFLLLLIGFRWMGVEYALLLALLTAAVDALPVLGTGMVLLPWAAGALLTGATGRAIALVVLYAVVLLIHSLLEPRLLAGQAGLPPVSALLAMYLGFHLFGVGGMVLLPLLLMLLKHLQDAGVVRIWKKGGVSR